MQQCAKFYAKAVLDSFRRGLVKDVQFMAKAGMRKHEINDKQNKQNDPKNTEPPVPEIQGKKKNK